MDDMDDLLDFASRFNERYGLLSRRIVRALSEDSRLPISAISKRVGSTRRTVKERMKKLEKELGLRYTVEFNEEALGISNPHLIVVRFKKEPNFNAIAETLRKSYIPQFAVRSSSGKELFIYANSATHSEYTRWDKAMQSHMSRYKVFWESSEVAHWQLGFFPLRNELIDKLGIPNKYKPLLKLLNSDARIGFQQISKAMGMHFNTVAYNFNTLVKLGYIKRFTLVCKPPKNVSLVAIFGKYALGENFEADASKIRRVFKSDEEMSTFSRYPIIAQLTGAYDFFDVGVFDSLQTGRDKFVNAYAALLKRHLAKLQYRELSDAILGDIPIRSVDDSKVYNTLKWTLEPDRL